MELFYPQMTSNDWRKATDKLADKTAPGRAGGQTARELLVDRYCELQPHLQRRLSVLLQGELRPELHAVTDHQRVVLAKLRSQSLTMRELAKKLAVGESAATAVVERLVRQGLVVRRDDPADRRVVRLDLSETGRVAVVELQAAACRRTAGLLSVLSDDQLEQLVGIMETLEAAATANAGVSSHTGGEVDNHKEQQQ
jgi:DNA-binding MarR family transcriptional regulator